MATKTGDQWVYRAGVPGDLHARVSDYLCSHGIAESTAIRVALQRLLTRPPSNVEMRRAAVAMGRPRNEAGR